MPCMLHRCRAPRSAHRMHGPLRPQPMPNVFPAPASPAARPTHPAASRRATRRTASPRRGAGCGRCSACWAPRCRSSTLRTAQTSSTQLPSKTCPCCRCATWHGWLPVPGLCNATSSCARCCPSPHPVPCCPFLTPCIRQYHAGQPSSSLLPLPSMPSPAPCPQPPPPDFACPLTGRTWSLWLSPS